MAANEMTANDEHGANDLVLTRVVAVPPMVIWKAWTEPEHLMKGSRPRPGGPRAATSISGPVGCSAR